MTEYEKERGIFEWYCENCGGFFDNLDPDTLERTCAFCRSGNIYPIYAESCEDTDKETS